ncbi:MAG TPA: hypothetical protein VI997_03435 [Candidatus Thermoplasmatota archaeon]|nr:hypothetical protein [Candidatus Thermoplasmatota archaeon]
MGDGAPARLPTEYTRYTPSVGETAYRRPDWAWKANWTYAASGMPRTPDAFPTLNGPGGLAAGEVTISVEGGLLRFVDDRDIERSIRLGLRDAEAAPFVAERQLVRMFFDGEIGSMATPPAEIWGIAGPDLTWTIDGTSRWTDARVSGTVDGRKLDSHKTDLLLEGAFAVVPDPGAGTFASPHEYAAEGRFARVEFDGRPMVAVSNSSVSNAVVTLSLAALLLGLLPFLWKAAVALYTRNHVSDVLDHPTRRRILELIEARPGLHKSGIRKEVGGAWGPFEFHLRALVAAGCVRTERERGFVLVYPTGERPAGPLLTPSTRRVYEAVPPDGAALGVVALRERLGMSRQRLRYHVNALERLHLVRLRPLPDGSFTIERNAVVTNTANTGAAGRTGVPGSNG